jgi:predicted nucleotidyltransferase
MIDPNREQLIRTVEALGELCEDLVFLGGSIVGILITDSGSEPVRATEDVDVIVEVASRLHYHRLTTRLEAKGFHPDPEGPICRYLFETELESEFRILSIDVMPLDEKILGFSNRWYQTAMHHFQTVVLNAQLSIKVITAPMFIATKLEAYHGRGQADPMMSHDLEDILMVLDGREALFAEIQAAPLEVRHYIAQEFSLLQQEMFFADLISGTFSSARGAMVRARIQMISNS